MKRTKSTLSMAMWLLVSTLICGLAAVFTSCGNNTLEEILGAVDNPAPKAATISFASATKDWGTLEGNFTLAVTNPGDGVVSYSSADPAIATINPTTGEVTPLTAGTTTITATVSNSGNYSYESHTAQYTLTVGTGYHYLEWNTMTKVFDVKYTTGSPLEGTVANTAITNGTYIIKGNVTISGDVTLSDDVELILSDGSNLNITGKVDGNSTSKSLTIYAQSEGSDMGQMNVEKEDAIAINLKGLTIHGGKVTAKATSTTHYGGGIRSEDDAYIYGGEVKAQGNDRTGSNQGGNGMILNTGTVSYTLNILNHAKVEAIGGKSSGGNGGLGIWGNVVISGDAELKATGGESSGDNSQGGGGIIGKVTASGHAKVTVNGGNGTDNDVTGGMGIGGITTVSDYAQLIATGGNGHGSKKGGNAIDNLTIYDNAYVEATGGNGGSSGDGGNAISYSFDYDGGKFVAIAGVKGTSGTSDGKAMNSLHTDSASPVTFQFSTDGTTWPTANVFDVSNENPNSTEARSRGVRKLD